MASGIDVTVERDISLIGRMVESARLFSDKSRNQENLAVIDEFFGLLVDLKGMPQLSPHGGALLWHDVPATAVADMLERFRIHPLNFAFDGETIASFLRKADGTDYPDLTQWTVSLPIAGTAGPVPFGSLHGVEIGGGLRGVKPNSDDGSLLVSGKSARVGGKSDVRHAISKEDLAALAAEDPDWTEDDVREVMKAPMLVVFPLRGVLRTGKKPDVKKTPFRDGLVLPALALHFPGTHDPDAPRNLVRYRLNKVAQKELFPADDEADDEDDDDLDAED
jgi:hypothetical protein